MLPLWPFLFSGRAGNFSRGFVFEGSSRAAWRHVRADGGESFTVIDTAVEGSGQPDGQIPNFSKYLLRLCRKPGIILSTSKF